METCDILIIGAGAAGIAAARSAALAGCKDILLVDRNKEMGGVLRQCAHTGFGRNLNGPQYTAQLLEDLPAWIKWYPNTTVLSVSSEKTAELCGPDIGKKTISFNQLIFAAGCREIPIGALPIAGTRPNGIYTAGQMQEMVNLSNILPKDPVVILGSGDLGLIMARHLAERNLSVTLIEQRSSCGGMLKNQTCLNEFPITLHCGTTISEVIGERVLEGVITEDGNRLPCKTLLIAVGLRPEQELIHSLKHSEWIHICGNCNKVHPMVEAVVNEGKEAGISAWENIRGNL